MDPSNPNDPLRPNEPAGPRQPRDPLDPGPIDPREPIGDRDPREPIGERDPHEPVRPRDTAEPIGTVDAPPPAEPPVVVASRPRWSRFALAAIALAAFVAVMAALAGLGARWGLWHFRTGFQLLEWSVYGAILTIVLAAIAIIRSRPGSGRRGLSLAVIALLIGIAVAYVPWNWRQTARSVPPIHDITTDLENPPEFSAIVPLRAEAPNPIEYGGPEVAAHQRQAYPDIRPLILDLPRDRAFQRALDAAEDMGWEIVSADADAGRIEATDRTFWFGFRDDVVIRLTPIEDRTVMDVRSLSRVGGSDVGTNARRVRKYLETVQP